MKGVAYTPNSILHAEKEDHYILVADSYGVKSANRGLSWCEKVIAELGLTACTTRVVNGNVVVYDTEGHQIDANTTNCWWMARGGQGFVGAGTAADGETEWGTWLETIRDEYPPGYDPLKVTKIIIAGGYNDYHVFDPNSSTHTSDPAGTLTAAIQAFYYYVKTTFPNAKVYLYFIGMGLQNTNILGYMVRAKNVYNAQGNGLVGWTYYQGFEGMLHNYVNLYNADSGADYLHHPSESGSYIVGTSIKNTILGAPLAKTQEYTTLTPYTGSDYTVTTTPNITFTTGLETNGLESYLFSNVFTDLTFSVAQPLNTWTKIGTLPSSYVTSCIDYRGTQTLSSSRQPSILIPATDNSGTKKVITLLVGVGTDGTVWVRTPDIATGLAYTKLHFSYAHKITQLIYVG